MPVLGRYGTLNLRRDLPATTAVHPEDVNFSRQSLFVQDEAYWTGDQVTLICQKGVPIGVGKSGIANCPDGYAFYSGGQYNLSPARHAINAAASFYNPDDQVPFYDDVSKAQKNGTYYIFRNELDEISFYPTLASALNNDAEFRYEIINVDFGEMQISPSRDVYYQNARATCRGRLGVYTYSDIVWMETGLSLCDYGPTYTEPTSGSTRYDNADVRPREELTDPWRFTANLTDWTLNLKSNEINTSTLGEKFGESVKALVTGGGSVNFLLDYPADIEDYSPVSLLRLMLLIEKGCKAEAKFQLIKNETPNVSALNTKPGLYYTTELLLVASAINMRADSLVAGTADFVTTGPINLRMTSQEVKE